MHAVLITLTPGRRNTSIDCQKAKVRIAVHSIMAVKTRLISTLEFFERAYRLWEFTPKWLQNSAYSQLQTLFTTQDEWTMVKYVMKVLRPL
jgi:vacuolar-type H+-ATPase subunit D/Vma8